MKWFWLPLVFTLAAIALFLREPLEDLGRRFADVAVPTTKEEEQVARIFNAYADLFRHGDPQSMSVYLPDAKLHVIAVDFNGQRHQILRTLSEENLRKTALLAQIHTGEARVRFDDVQYRQLWDGKVRVTFAAYLNDDPPDHVALVFVNTAPDRWAICEETHHLH